MVKPPAPAPSPTPSAAVRLRARDRRQQILDRALPVFAAAGQSGAGTRQLAAAAGISEPILYRHFRGKDVLFGAVLAETAARLGAALEAVAAAHDGAAARLGALADGLPDLIGRHQDELRVLCGAAAAPADAATRRAVARAFARLAQVLQRALGGGGLRPGVQPQAAALFLLEVGLGAALLRPAGMAAVARREFGRRAAALLRAALLPANRPPASRRPAAPSTARRPGAGRRGR
ncbi:MAG: TetR/AcrR family transcriptional regulator [Planctomycetota bacterium]